MSTAVTKIQSEDPLEFDPLDEGEIKSILGDIEGSTSVSKERGVEIQFCMELLASVPRPQRQMSAS